MKKYLMTGVAAFAICAAFTSCSKSEELYDPEAVKGISTEQEIANVYEQYNRAFIATFGQPAANQDWGFGTTRAFTRAEGDEENPHVNANANEWANNINNDNTGHGGWLVPDELTEGQKQRVTAYFQSNYKPGYKDPDWSNFFVQQVYKGGNTTVRNTTEGIIAANNSEYTSDNMNLMTVGEGNIHINNFNKGDATERTDVLNNGSDILAGKTSYHSDKIMLMINIDDTSCFGYHETGSSNHHNNKAALVSAADIDKWAKDYGNNVGEAVSSDKWNRSFLGFDLAIAEGEQAYDKNNDGSVNYADYTQCATTPEYAWDGKDVFRITTGEYKIINVTYDWGTMEQKVPVYKDEYEYITNAAGNAIGWLSTNENFYVAAEERTVLDEISDGEIDQSRLTEEKFQNAIVFKDVKVPGAQNNKAHVINLKLIKDLVKEGYLPVKNKTMREWVKVGTSDGYYSDWIVTLTEAKRQEGNTYVDRIICEDLNAKAANSDPAKGGLEESDWDFNDVVFDVRYDDANTAWIKIRVIGGVLPLYVGDEAHEVHELCGQKPGEDGNYSIVGATNAIDEFKVTINGVQASHGKLIPIKVKRQLADNETAMFDMTAEVGKPAAKIRVDPQTFTPCGERQDIRTVYDEFANWVKNPIVVWY